MLSCGLSYFFLALVAAVVAVGCSPADNEVAASDPWAISRDGTRPVVELVVPTFNEADRMPLSDFRAFVARNDNNSSFGPVFQLLFVNDGSTDDTLAHLQRIRGPHVRILNLDENVGKAEAVRLGLRHSLLGDDGLMASSIPDFVGFWDADLATPLDEVFTFMQVFQQHPRLEMILGSRVALLGRNISRRAERHYLGRIFATGASMVLGLPVYDTQCGAKLFRASKDLIAMIAEPFQSRWIFDVELLARFVRLRERSVLALQPVNVIYEQPLARWEDIPGSKLNLKSKVVALLELFEILQNYFMPWSPPVQQSTPNDAATRTNPSSIRWPVLGAFLGVTVLGIATFVLSLWCVCSRAQQQRPTRHAKSS